MQIPMPNDALYVTGGTPLHGDVRIHTAKNSALYLMLAAILTREVVTLKDVPRLSDVLVMQEILEHFGADVTWNGRDLTIHAEHVYNCGAPYELVSRMRASFVALGALLGRCGEARISMPGGCAFGPRPVDRHIKAFRALGVQMDEDEGDFLAMRVKPLAGRVGFEAPTVGGTQNVILASAVGSDVVVIENAALEPEVKDLCDMLNRMGARISGGGTTSIRIEGVRALGGIEYRPIPDRIEAGTFMLATAATRGRVTLRGVDAGHLMSVSAKLSEAGVQVLQLDASTLLVDATGALHATDVTASEYPGIPTDLQAPFGAFLATVEGRSVVSDRVYPDRYTHVGELKRTGARLELKERSLIVYGRRLQGAELHAADIRAGGALVVAALAADGESVVSGASFLARGYEAMVERLGALGARIRHNGVLAPTGTYGT